MICSVIVPIFNGLSFLPAFFDSLAAALPPNSEVLCVDDASTEPVAECIPKSIAQHEFRLKRNPVNLGYASTVNRMLKKARGEVIEVLNSDLVLTPDCLNELLSFINRTSNCGVAGAKLSYPDTGRVQHAGMAFGKFSRRHVFLGLNADHPLCNITHSCQTVTGAIHVFRRSLIDEIGLLDENYYNHNEDLDFCLRAQAAGYKNYYVHSARAYHWESASGPSRFAGTQEADALFWSRWGSRYEIDLGSYFSSAFRFIQKENEGIDGRRFDVINLCKSLDRHIALDEFFKLWDAEDVQTTSINPNLREHEKLHFSMRLPYWAQDNRKPYLYLVDRIDRLSENWQWFERRTEVAGSEIVMDLNAAHFVTS